MQKLLGLLRKADTDFNMIENGDHIAVGISGGKDSIMLLALLARYQKFATKKFKLSAINIDLGFDYDLAEVQNLVEYCKKIEVPLYIVKTDNAKIIFEDRKEKRPCSLCSKMRRGAINTKAIEIGANKIALGHHIDDALETLFLSLIYEGRLSTFSPTAYMDRTKITLIRPLIYIQENQVNKTVKKFELPIVNNPCPMDKHSEREYMKNLIDNIDKDIPDAKKHMLRALMNPERNNLWEPKK